MLRFLALVWSPAEEVAEGRASRIRAKIRTDVRWRPVLIQDGLCVFSSCSDREFSVSHRLLSNKAGIVIGSLFERSPELDDTASARARSFCETETDRILAEGPIRLIEHYWGWYVAFIHRPLERSTCVLRSPMGDLPCLHATVDRVHLCFSRVDDALLVADLNPTIDWELIRQQVGFGQLNIVGQSAIREFELLERGEVLWINNGQVRKRLYWDPCAFARSPMAEDPHHVAALLRATVMRCVHTWVAEHEDVLHRLSGGLDSALLLHCMASASTRPKITAINYYWEGAVADERRYARAIAASAGTPLHELRFGTTITLEILRHVRRTPAPVMDVIDWQEHARETDIARRCDATAIFMGSLGDTLFERDITWSAATDHLRAAGFEPAFFETLMNVALRTRTSVWTILKMACRDAWFRPLKGSWSTQAALLESDVLKHRNMLVHDETVDRLRDDAVSRNHVWLRNVEGVPHGKLWQIGGLFAESFYDRQCVTEDSTPVVAAYMSQPLAELCLRIPSYLNVREGVDRAMVRHAFAEALPASILRRSAKGSPDGWLQTIIERDAKFIREFLLEGVLVRERIVDRRKLQSALPGTVSTRATNTGSILNLVCTEAWLQAWSGIAH